MAAQIFLKLGEVGAESGTFSQKLLKRKVNNYNWL